MVLEIHSVDALATGFATVPLVDGSALGPAGMFGAYNLPVSGSVTIDQMSLGGNSFHLAGWFAPPSAGSFPWEWPVWDLARLWLPFDGAAAPSDLAGTWAVVPESNMGRTPAEETVTVGTIQAHVFAGAVARTGGAMVDLVAGRVSGNTIWFAVHDDEWTEWGIPAFRVWAGTLDGAVGSGVYLEFVGQYYDLFDQGTWSATRM